MTRSDTARGNEELHRRRGQCAGERYRLTPPTILSIAHVGNTRFRNAATLVGVVTR